MTLTTVSYAPIPADSHRLTDDEYRVMKWHLRGSLAGRFRDGVTHRWTESLRAAYVRLVRMNWLDQDWTTTVTAEGKRAMQRHRRGGR